MTPPEARFLRRFENASNLAARPDVGHSNMIRSEEVLEILDGLLEKWFLLDGDWRIVYANQPFLEFVGRPPEAVIHEYVWDVFPQERLLRFRSEARRAVQEQRPVSFVEYAPSLDRWLYTRVHPSPPGLLVTIEDRTEDARSGNLDGTGGTDRLLGDLVIGYAYAYRIEGEEERVLEWLSDSFEQITGYSPQQMREANGWLGVVHPEDRDRVVEMAAALWRGEAVEEEYRIIRRDGQVRWLADRMRPGLDDDGRIARIHGFAHDVTERREREEAVRREGLLLQSLITALPLPVVGLDRSGKVTHWNRAAEATFGWREAEVAGGAFPGLSEDQREEHAAILEDALEGRGVFQGAEIRRRRKDGSTVDLEIWAAPIRIGPGDAEQAIAVLLDITDRRVLEEQLRRAQRMEAIGRLAGGIAHDFNNLLTVIQGRTQLLLEAANLAPPHRSDLEEAQSAAERAALLTRHLLAFSRRQVLQPAILDLNAVVRDLEPMIRRLIGEHIDVVTRLDPELGNVKVDPAQIQQVILNLAVNARDAMPEGGRLTMATANVELDDATARRHPYVVRTGRYVLLSVTDTGAGMDAETQAHIFEPFFTTKGLGKGTGLGLSTVYGIVKQSQGYIWVDSDVGRGTSFEIHLPRIAGAPSTAGEEATAEEGAAPTSFAPAWPVVLLVEDEDALRRLASNVLQRAGFQVLHAADDVLAMQRAEAYRGPIHVLLTDMALGPASGLDVARQIQAARPDIRIIYMSGDGEDFARELDLRPGRAVFLPKPFTPAQLVATVRELLQAD
jgi:two-component system cell cycle sensor histidine kinase/response regulator CckA